MSDGAGDTPLEDLISGRPSSARQRRIMWIIVFAALIALGVLILRFFTGHDTSYIAQPVVRRDFEPHLSIGGMLYPAEERDVGMPFPGTVAEVYVGPSAKVAAGQPLARIDPADGAQALVEMRAAVASARAEIASASAAWRQAETSCAKIEEVFRQSNGRVPSRSELEAARSSARARKADLDVAQGRLHEAEVRLSDAQEQMSRSVIRAPIDGYVTVANAKVGAAVSDPNEPMFTVSPDIARMRMDVMVPQATIGDIRRRTRVKVTVNSLPDRRFEAWVHDIATIATGTPPVFHVSLIAINRQKLLRRGMRGTVDIPLPARKNALLVPNAAFHFEPAAKRAPSERNDGRETLYRLNRDGGVDPVAVSAGSTDGNLTEVHSDTLKEGDLVAVGWWGTPGGKTAAEK